MAIQYHLSQNMKSSKAQTNMIQAAETELLRPFEYYSLLDQKRNEELNITNITDIIIN
jgi:hypothetical protein